MGNEFGRVRLLKNWNFWDNNIHSEKPQIERQGRAMYYPFTFEINENEKTATFSSSTDLPYYNTSLSSCDCYDFQERKLPCKHIYRLAVELGYIEIFNRPTFDKEALAKIKNSSDVDNEPDQLKRQKSALEKKCTPVSIDKEHCVAVFKSSGKGFYEATLETCTCRDYFVRRLPCKHIYRLRTELAGAVTPDSVGSLDFGFEKEEAKEMLKSLTEQEAYAYIYCTNFDKWVAIKEKERFGNLPASPLVICSEDLDISLSFLKKDNLISICNEYSIPYGKPYSKAALIEALVNSLSVEQQSELKKKMPLSIKRNDKAKEVFGAVKSLYHRLYPTQSNYYDFS